MRRPSWLALLAAAAVAAVVAAGWSPAGRGRETGGGAAGGDARTRTASVVRVVDGDTIKVRLDGGGTDRVRYVGVDTPESVKPGTPVQCFAKAAAARNAALLPRGERVRLVADVEARDRYGRLLAYVYRARDGRFVNAALVRDGYARTLTIPPNVRYAGRFRALAAEARRAGRGLWRACGGQ